MILVLLDEGHGVFGEIIDEETLALHEDAIVFERSVEVIAPMAGAKPVGTIEATPMRGG